MELKTLCILMMLTGLSTAINERMKKGMAGGISDVTDTELKKIPEVVENALAKFETMRDRLEGSYNTGCTLTKPLVSKVRSQVVRGKMYYITVVAGLSPTPKSYMHPSTCSPKPDELQKAFIQCTIKVWSQPMMNSDGHVTLSAEAQDFSIDEDCQPADYKFSRAEHRDQFDQFLKKYPREYSKKNNTSDYEYRFSVFVQNMATVDMMNRFEQGTAKYGPTKFADMTEAEFRKLQSGRFRRAGVKKQAAIPKDPAPEQFDWRSKGAVTPVKNQGMCGSCWAFSAIGNIEGQWQIKKGELISLSEQELVDCDKVDGGCQGGEMRDAYEAIIKLGGVMSEADYSYRGADEKCKFNASEVRVKINGYVNISKDETEMAQWLAGNGPISIGINALAMQFYFGGIAHPWKIFCNPDSLDHGVLIVGYGVKDGEPYWIVKNSWGKDWGEEGYYLVYRGDGTCGLNLDNTSSTVE